jgi:hypothetical protein
MKSAKEAIQTAKNVVAFPKPPARRQRDEIAFLPAALEIVETPPSPIGRAMGATLIAVFCLGLIWACFGHVDIVATATGKVVPNGRVKLIQPFETGVVRAIEIRDGQSVKAGDVLIELDPTMSTAEEEHIKNDLMAARLDVARLRAGLSDADDPQTEFNPPAGASPAQVKMQQAYLAKQVEEHRAKIATLDRQQAQKQAERDTAAATIQKLERGSTRPTASRSSTRAARCSITRIACPATSAASGCTAPPVTSSASIRAKNRRASPLPTSAGRSPILMSVSPCRARSRPNTGTIPPAGPRSCASSRNPAIA